MISREIDWLAQYRQCNKIENQSVFNREIKKYRIQAMMTDRIDAAGALSSQSVIGIKPIKAINKDQNNARVRM